MKKITDFSTMQQTLVQTLVHTRTPTHILKPKIDVYEAVVQLLRVHTKQLYKGGRNHSMERESRMYVRQSAHLLLKQKLQPTQSLSSKGDARAWRSKCEDDLFQNGWLR